VTVIRDGELVQTCGIDEMDISSIVKVMAGKELEDRYPKLKVKIGKEILHVEKLSFEGRIKDISFELKKGEILGITGLSGSGRRTLAKVLCGIEGNYEGRIFINGKEFRHMTPHIAKMNGMCYVSGIGTEEGLVNEMSVAENITLTNLERISRMNFIDRSLESEAARDLIERLEISAGEDEVVNNLSGGKQKKVPCCRIAKAEIRG
ncbi:MAG: ATP-binding cassette domain-containing protein, partial [Firmicutes bacterium]|nr:ATP-binding cassette domain-containing protein [Bacillota bacterium]